MTQETDTIQILWDAIEKRDKAVAEIEADIHKAYEQGYTNIDSRLHRLGLLTAELRALHEVLTAIQGCPSRMTVADVYVGQPWDHDEFRYLGRVVTGIEESRNPRCYTLYLEVTDEHPVFGNTWLNRKPVLPREAQPTTKLSPKQRSVLEYIAHPDRTTQKCWLDHKPLHTNTYQALMRRDFIRLSNPDDPKWKELVITDAGRKALEGAQ